MNYVRKRVGFRISRPLLVVVVRARLVPGAKVIVVVLSSMSWRLELVGGKTGCVLENWLSHSLFRNAGLILCTLMLTCRPLMPTKNVLLS